MTTKKFIVGVPYSGCEYKSEFACTREDEALAMAAGAWLAGKNAFVFMQNSGLGTSLDVITSLLLPYEIDLDIEVVHRDTPAHHKCMGAISHLLMEMIGYEKKRSD